ncbi:hypothetical protein GCM10010319_70560 [Streptomyces blastmyceticus]|uniref:Uncharacterized protein n=1 Tax=Streptomyces blastmyceticus TaxID=68180 RepID=A0ABN0Y3H1_9ACTN
MAAARAERAVSVSGEPSHPITVTRSAIVVSLLGLVVAGRGAHTGVGRVRLPRSVRAEGPADGPEWARAVVRAGAPAGRAPGQRQSRKAPA